MAQTAFVHRFEAGLGRLGGRSHQGGDLAGRVEDQKEGPT